MTLYVTAPPILAGKAALLANEHRFLGAKVKVIIDPKCPPERIYLTTKSLAAKPFKGPDPRPVKKPSKKKGKK